jgi:hypothetical protein
MSEITLAAIAKTMETVLKQELDPIKTTLAGHTELFNQHTTLLDSIAKDVKILLDEKTIAAARLARLEKWAQQVGEKVGVKLDLQTLVP